MGYDKELTKQLLGDIGPLRYNPKVVKVCQKCGKQDIVRYKGANKPTANYYCRSCVVQRPQVLLKLSKATQKQWQNGEFRKLVQKSSQNIWQDDQRRYKMSAIRRDPQNTVRLRTNAKQAGVKSIQCQAGKVSKIQTQLYSLLDDLNIAYIKEFQLGPYLFDCFIPSHDLLIECNGDYWHNLSKNSARDKAKATFISEYFQQYKLHAIWEHEFKNHQKIVEVLKYWLGITEMELASFEITNIQIRPATASDCQSLLSKYHYLANTGRAGIKRGGYLNDELVCTAVFSPLSRQNIKIATCEAREIRELTRFCIHPRYQKKNLATWFLSRAIKSLPQQYKCIIAYSDTGFNHYGTIYKAANFTLDKKVKPDYWYRSVDGWVMHKKTLYNHAKSLNLTEAQFAGMYEYTKVWGKEKLRFIYYR